MSRSFQELDEILKRSQIFSDQDESKKKEKNKRTLQTFDFDSLDLEPEKSFEPIKLKADREPPSKIEPGTEIINLFDQKQDQKPVQAPKFGAKMEDIKFPPSPYLGQTQQIAHKNYIASAVQHQPPRQYSNFLDNLSRIAPKIPVRVNIPAPRDEQDNREWYDFIVDSYKRGDTKSNLDLLGVNALFEHNDWETEVKPLMDEFFRLESEDPIKANNFLLNSLAGASRTVPAMGKGMAAGAVTAGVLGGTALAFLPEEFATIPTLSAAGGMMYWAAQGAGDVYNSLRYEGINHDVAKTVSLLQAPLYAGIEQAQTLLMLPKPIRNSVNRSMSRAVSRALITAMINKGKDYATEVLEEGAQAIIQEAAKEFARELDPEIKNSFSGKTILKIAETAVEEMAMAAQTMPWLMAPGSAVDATNYVRRYRLAGLADKITEEVKTDAQKPDTQKTKEDATKRPDVTQVPEPQIREQEAQKPALTEKLPDVSLTPEKPPVEKQAAPEEPIKNLVGSKVKSGDIEGILSKDEEGNYIIESKDFDLEVGRVVTDSLKKPSELNIEITEKKEPKETKKVEIIDFGNKVKIDDKMFDFVSINEKKDGTVSVTLIRPDGKKITMRDPETAFNVEIERNKFPNEFQALEETQINEINIKKSDIISDFVSSEEISENDFNKIDTLLAKNITDDIENIIDRPTDFSIEELQAAQDNILFVAEKVSEIEGEYSQKISDGLINLAEGVENAKTEKISIEQRQIEAESVEPERESIETDIEPEKVDIESSPEIKMPDIETLKMMKTSLESSTAGRRGKGGGTRSTFPSWNKGRSNRNTIPKIDKILDGKEITEKQQKYLEELYSDYLDSAEYQLGDRYMIRETKLLSNLNDIDIEQVNEFLDNESSFQYFKNVMLEEEFNDYEESEIKAALTELKERSQAFDIEESTAKTETKIISKPESEKFELKAPKKGELEAIDKKVEERDKKLQKQQKEKDRIDKKYDAVETPTPKLFSEIELAAEGQTIGLPFDENELKSLKEAKTRGVKKGRELVLASRSSDAQAFNEFSPTDTKEDQKQFKNRQEMVRYMSENLGVPIRKGKFNQKALGIFKIKPRIIRIKKGLLSTESHEIGHFLRESIPEFKAANLKPFESEFKKFATPGDVLEEGHAEFVRMYVTQPKIAKSESPKYFDYFEKIMEKYAPEALNILKTVQGDIRRWVDQPATQKILSEIDQSPKKKRAWSLRRIYTNFIDDIHPIKKYVDLAKKYDVQVSDKENAYIAARLLRGWGGKVAHWLHKGSLDINNQKIGPALEKILRPFEMKNDLDSLRVYLISQRVLELKKRGINTQVSITDAQNAIEELEQKYPDIKKTADLLYDFQNNGLKYLKDGGLISEQSFEKMRELNKKYVPFYRVYEEKLGLSQKAGLEIGDTRSPIKRIKGSEREFIDPIESIIKNTYAFVNVVERNKVAQNMAALSEKHWALGQLFERIPAKKIKKAQFKMSDFISDKTLEQLKIENEEGDLELDPLLEEVLEKTRQIWGVTDWKGENVIHVMEEGKATYYEVDPELYSAMKNLDHEQSHLFIQLLSYPARWLRAGATLNPDFPARNLFRDQIQAAIFSNHGFLPVIDTAKGLFSAIRKDDLYWDWVKSGGAHSALVSLDRDYLQEEMKKLGVERVKNKKFQESIIDMSKQPLKILAAFSEILENATRIGVYNRAKIKGATEEAAAYDSREATQDFQRVGAKTKAINQIIAFFNAAIGGNDRLIREFAENPFKATAKSFLYITLPSLLLYYANKDDERYKEIPQWQKDLFWIVLTEDNIYRIPKPFTLGIVFGSLFERVATYIDENDPKAFENYMGSLLGTITPGVIPTFAQPLLENMVDYSFFRGQKLLPASLKNVENFAQFTPYTSETLKQLGSAFNLSPIKMENIVRGYGGGLGRMQLENLDKLLEITGVITRIKKPETTLADIPVIRGFVVRNPIGSASQSVNTFYKNYEKFLKKKNTYRELTKTNPKKAVRFKYQNLKEINMADQYSRGNRELAKIRREMTQIWYKKQMSSKIKRKMLDQLSKDMTAIAKSYNKRAN